MARRRVGAGLSRFSQVTSLLVGLAGVMTVVIVRVPVGGRAMTRAFTRENSRPYVDVAVAGDMVRAWGQVPAHAQTRDCG